MQAPILTDGTKSKRSWAFPRFGKAIFIGAVIPTVLAVVTLLAIIITMEAPLLFKKFSRGASDLALKFDQNGDEARGQILAAFDSWRRALSARDISGLERLYSRDFYGRGNNSRADIIQGYRNVFSDASSLTVLHNGLDIRVRESHATLRCEQYLWVDAYSDYGRLTITFTREDGSWRIISENWDRW